jgi:hypothetical protein
MRPEAANREHAHMLTRRAVLGLGLAVGGLACTQVWGRSAPTVGHLDELRAVDALLVDETMEMPEPLATLLGADVAGVPIVGIHLDAASHKGVMAVLQNSQTVLGFSSGATLFCLERMAWEHGFRLTERHEQCAGEPFDDACLHDLSAVLSGRHRFAADASVGVRDYRPSRVDQVIHAWVLQKKPGPNFDGRQLEFQT